MIEIRSCEADDLRQVDSLSPKGDRELVLENIAENPGMEVVLQNLGRSLTLDGRVIACFGVWPLWPGVARAWSDLSQEALDRPKALYSNVREQLGKAEEQLDLRRVEAVIAKNHAVAHGWIRHLGFELEGTMHNYGVGGVGDFCLYARTRE